MDVTTLSDDDLLRQLRQSSQPVAKGGPTRITVRPSDARPVSQWSDDELLRAVSTPPSIGEDVAKSIPAGLAKGVSSLVGLPGDAQEGVSALADFLVDKLGVPKQAYEETKRLISQSIAKFPTSRDVRSGVESVTGPLYEPKTTPGKYAGVVSEFVPGAVLGPGGVFRNAIRFGAVPGVASETAGRATEGTTAEPYARAGAAVLSGGAAAMLSRPASTQQTLRRALPGNVDNAAMDRAAALMQEAQQRGINLTWAEAIEQVAPGTGLPGMQRTLEGASASRNNPLNQFFAARPGQVQGAVRGEADNIAPRNLAPSNIGPAAGREAQGVLDNVRGVINQATRPLYQAAEPVRIQPQDFARIRNIPAFQAALREVRNDPILGPPIAGMTDDSIAVIDAVQKRVQAMEQGAVRSTERPDNYRASLLGQGRTDMLAAADAASPAYQTARQTQATARQTYLEPLENGPLGRLAKRDQSTRQAIDALFPTNPLPGSEDEIAIAVGALARRSPNVARDLVRAHVESVFNEASQNLVGGMNQFGGAKFAAVIAGNPQQRANLREAIRALPNGDQIWLGFNRFLDVVEATGKRQPIGSRTAFNAQELADLSRGRVLSEGGKAATSPTKMLSVIGEAWDRWQLGRNVDQLARILTDPGSGRLLRQIANMPVGSGEARLLAMRLITTYNVARNQSSDKRAKPNDAGNQ